MIYTHVLNQGDEVSGVRWISSGEGQLREARLDTPQAPQGGGATLRDRHNMPVIGGGPAHNVRRSVALPANCPRTIVDWEVSESGNQYHLSVMSAV
jgi:hypothetical protein